MPPENDDSNIVNDTPSPDAELSNKMNSVVSAHMKRFAEKQLPGLLGPMLEAALKPFSEKLATFSAPAADDEGKSKGKKGDASPEFQALQAKLTDWETKYATAESARVAAEKKSRDDSAQQALRAALQPHVKPELLDILSDNLYHRKSVIDFEEDGTPIFKSKKTDGWGGEEDVRLPLKAGVEQYLKSADAKPFLPAPGSSSAPPLRKTTGTTGTAPVELDKMTDNQKLQRSMEISENFKKR